MLILAHGPAARRMRLRAAGPIGTRGVFSGYSQLGGPNTMSASTNAMLMPIAAAMTFLPKPPLLFPKSLYLLPGTRRRTRVRLRTTR